MDIIKSALGWIIGISYMIVLFPLTFILWLLALPFDRERVFTHWLLVYQSLIFTRLMPIWKVSVEGRKKAKSNTTYVVIANHQSILDILLLNCLRYKFKWISKIENVKVPLLGWYLKMADYITVDRGDDESKAEMLERSYKCLNRGISLMIFPEGTRSHDREIGFFKRGAFQLAIQANVPLLPVIIDGTGGILPKHGIIFRGGNKIKIKVLDPVLPETFGSDNPDLLAQKIQSLMTEGLKLLRAENPAE
jgi:1-acyl-sn-glycerol-3-phosphate acyltransferase